MSSFTIYHSLPFAFYSRIDFTSISFFGFPPFYFCSSSGFALGSNPRPCLSLAYFGHVTFCEFYLLYSFVINPFIIFISSQFSLSFLLFLNVREIFSFPLCVFLFSPMHPSFSIFMSLLLKLLFSFWTNYSLYVSSVTSLSISVLYAFWF